jgi:protein MpaA
LDGLLSLSRMRGAPAAALLLLCSAGSAFAASVEVIGKTRQGREIRAIHGGEPAGPTVLIVGCIHGNECAGRALVGPLLGARMTADLWIVPTLNPDGYAARVRQNAAGVDLNRNWPRWWRQEGVPWSTYYSGPRASSEPETLAGRRLIARIRPRVTIWYHQHLNLVWASGTSIPLGRIYARALAMRIRTDDAIGGTATGWQRRRFPDTRAFVVELPAGPLRATARVRHVRAIRRIVRRLAG